MAHDNRCALHWQLQMLPAHRRRVGAQPLPKDITPQLREKGQSVRRAPWQPMTSSTGAHDVSPQPGAASRQPGTATCNAHSGTEDRDRPVGGRTGDAWAGAPRGSPGLRRRERRASSLRPPAPGRRRRRPPTGGPARPRASATAATRAPRAPPAQPGPPGGGTPGRRPQCRPPVQTWQGSRPPNLRAQNIPPPEVASPLGRRNPMCPSRCRLPAHTRRFGMRAYNRKPMSQQEEPQTQALISCRCTTIGWPAATFLHRCILGRNSVEQPSFWQVQTEWH